MRRFLFPALFLLLLASACGIFAQLTENNAINAVPAPKKVVIDGQLGEWDLSGKIVMCYDVEALLDTYSAQLAMMYDKDALYVGINWCDPTPMVNNYDPYNDVDRRTCFHSDSIEIMFNGPKARRNLFAWYYTKGNAPGALFTLGQAWWREKTLTYIDAMKECGVTQGFTKNADGKGYIQEIRIPWSAIDPSGKTYQAGDEIPCMFSMVWGPANGKGWPESHIVDMIQPGAAHTDWFWNIGEVFGTLKLSATGNLKNVPSGIRRNPKTLQQGTVPVRATIPVDAKRFTIAINDAQGNRIRNLAGDFSAEDYSVEVNGNQRIVEVKWDGLDDGGNLVAPGEYRVLGLAHKGLDAIYDMSYYNPGTPPWETADGSGAWMSDHNLPVDVASGADWIVISADGAEGGSGIIGIGPDGKKHWGEKSGATALAADDKYVYFMLQNSWAKKTGLARLALHDGSYAPFVINGKEEYPVSLTMIFGEQTSADLDVLNIAVSGETLALALNNGKLAILDAATTKLQKIYDIPRLQRIAVGRHGEWYAVANDKVVAVNVDNGQVSPIATPGLGQAGALAVNNQGNIVIVDKGNDSQVKTYSPKGILLSSAGRKGGRPIRGKFDPQAMIGMSGVAVDVKGQIWVVEHWDYPRRVSVWGKDGKLIRDYLGNTGYAGVGGFLHETDPSIAYIGPIEFKLDYKKRTWTPTQTLWAPDQSKGESFAIQTGSNVMPMRFTSRASGKPHEYMYSHDARDGGGNVIYMLRKGKWQPVAAVCAIGHISGFIDHSGIVTKEPSGEFAGLNAFDGCIWNDKNNDGIVQRTECTIVPTKKPGRLNDQRNKGDYGLSLINGWGGRIGQDNLTFYTNGIIEYRPISFTKDGAPIYGLEGMREIGAKDRGDLVPVPDENLLICMNDSGSAYSRSYMKGYDIKTGALRWSYPNDYPFVHGSHKAPMNQPGLVIGPLKICGVADMGKTIGKVFLMRGNMGEDYLMTTDGLYVGALFKDGRLPFDAFPSNEEQLIGKSLAKFSNGGEPFNGWFGRQADGKVRTVNGFPRQASLIADITGLETITRYTGPLVTLDATTLAQCEHDNIARASATATAASYTVRSFAQAPAIDGALTEWAALPEAKIERNGSPYRATAKLAYDSSNLYAAFTVIDPSPWKNEGKDFTRLFKTGDAVDLQLCVNPNAGAHKQPVAGDVRVVISQVNGKPVAVIMRPVEPGITPEQRMKYHSPVGDKFFDRVEIINDAKVAVKTTGQGYTVEAAIPLQTLGLTPKAGLSLRGDLGFIASDTAGLVNVARIYWANKVTNIVSDLPMEAWLYPDTWGEIKFE